MSFPVSPLDGQSAIVNNILYTYSQTYNTWTRVPGTTVLGGVSNTDGVLMWNTANAAFGVANTANSLARGAFTKANTTETTVTTNTSYINSMYPKTNAAFLQANSAYNQANAAFEAANAAGSSSTVTSAFNTANAAYGQANTNATNITLVGDFANGAFTKANTVTAVASYANGAFTKANTATTSATAAFSQANAAFSQANVAFETANSKTFIFYQNTAPTTANTRDEWVDSDTGIKYQNLNGTTPLWVELGPTTAVSESPTATAAFDKANTAITTAGGSIVGRLNVAYTPASTVNTAMLITAANSKGGTGYADIFQLTNTSGGATNPNKYIRLTSIGELQVVNSSYQMTPLSMTDAGDVVLAGNLTMNGITSGYAPNRPAFRVVGNGGQVTATTTLTSSNWTVDFNQGGYLNSSTGVFTAPVAGLYQVNALIRTSVNNSGSIIQALVRKTAASGGAETTIIMIEYGPNTSMNHAGGSSIVKLAVGDTLKLIASAGTISFDGNDNWSVAYIG